MALKSSLRTRPWEPRLGQACKSRGRPGEVCVHTPGLAPGPDRTRLPRAAVPLTRRRRHRPRALRRLVPTPALSKRWARETAREEGVDAGHRPTPPASDLCGRGSFWKGLGSAAWMLDRLGRPQPAWPWPATAHTSQPRFPHLQNGTHRGVLKAQQAPGSDVLNVRRVENS